MHGIQNLPVEQHLNPRRGNMQKFLKKFSYIVPVVALAIGSATIATSSAEAAGHWFCVDYANSAVSQQGRNLGAGCGYSGLRWHFGWALHYQWCTNVAAWQGMSERSIREGMLTGCGA
jgi:hypothetical protein